MPEDHIRYDLLAQAALRGVVRTVLADAARKGLPGEHHFKITFTTGAPGLRLSERMRAQYPDTMTIVLQHQFWDLAVRDEAFDVGLSFGGIAERLTVPFEAVTAFVDPSVQFGIQFETIEAGSRGEGAPAKPAPETPVAPTALPIADSKKTDPAAAPPAGEPPPDGGGQRKDQKSGQVVSLDRFRKK
ncbi:MAG: ClpXP protease specificity-enhancing factor SspB [Xanthobacteraceae bacterium]